MTEIRFDSRVALVTGAGKGLGRAYARLLAARGASVVVNNRKREGAGEKGSADLVVDEIVADGGTAIPNHDPVETWEAGQSMVAQAVDTFGRLDILINNAGVDQHAPLHKIEIEDFERIFAINFLGSFYATKAALPVMRDAGFGRILFSTSSAGLYGLHGLSAYSASKAAVVGLMRAVAQEGHDHNINANAIAPYASTQMTAAHLAHLPAERLSADLVAPVAAWLVSEACNATGDIYVAGCGHVRRAQMMEGKGVRFDPSPALTPEAVARQADAFRDMSDAHTYPDAMANFLSFAPHPED